MLKVDKTKTEKLYFDETGRMIPEVTPDWIEIYEEIPHSVKEKYIKQQSEGAKLEMTPNKSFIIHTNGISTVNLDVIVSSIKDSSEGKITTDIIKEMKNEVISELWDYLTKKYKLAVMGNNPIDSFFATEQEKTGE